MKKLNLYLTPDRNITITTEGGLPTAEGNVLIGIIEPIEHDAQFVRQALEARLAYADVNAMRVGTHWILPARAYAADTQDTVAIDVRPTHRLQSANRPALVPDVE